MLLSVVVVAKNEEKNIARCIESVLNCTEYIKNKEVLLVDSYSSDKTVEIAKQYHINIIQLGKDWPHSPSAGRFTGVNNVIGKYILIIDGDMELQKGWVEYALKYLEENSKVAAVVGMTCLREGLGEALAEARATSKPVLTESALNRLFAQSKAKGQLPKLAAQISPDIKGWLMSNFSLTKIQQDAISSFTSDQIQQMQKVLRFVEETSRKATLTVSFTSESHHSHAVPWRCKAHAEARDSEGHKVEADASVSSSSY